MKKQHFFLIALAILLITVMVNCQKDYREKWVGDWDLIVIEYKRDHYDERHDTICYLGKISLGDAPDRLNINYKNGFLIVGEDGGAVLFYGQWWIPRAYGNFIGNNKLYMSYRSEDEPGSSPQFSHTLTIDGVKREESKKE